MVGVPETAPFAATVTPAGSAGGRPGVRRGAARCGQREAGDGRAHLAGLVARCGRLKCHGGDRAGVLRRRGARSLKSVELLSVSAAMRLTRARRDVGRDGRGAPSQELVAPSRRPCRRVRRTPARLPVVAVDRPSSCSAGKTCPPAAGHGEACRSASGVGRAVAGGSGRAHLRSGTCRSPGSSRSARRDPPEVPPVGAAVVDDLPARLTGLPVGLESSTKSLRCAARRRCRPRRRPRR